MVLDLSDEEAAALTRHLRQALDYNPYPLAPRLDPLKVIPAKLEPPARRPAPLSPLNPGMGPNVGREREAVSGYSRAAMTLGNADSLNALE